MPTIKQKKVFDKIAENHGNLSKTMREVGYSPNTAKKPQNLTESKGWNKLVEKYLSDAKLGKVHNELLSANRLEKSTFHHKLKDEEVKAIIEGQGFKFIGTKRFMTTAIVYFSMPDHLARKNGLDMAYKLKGKYAPEKSLVGHFEINNEKKIQTDEIIRRILASKNS